MVNPLIRKIPNTPYSHGNEHRSAGILDDFAVRKNIATSEGTVEKVPVNGSDITNKTYVDSNPTNIPLNSIVISDGTNLTGSNLLEQKDGVAQNNVVLVRTFSDNSNNRSQIRLNKSHSDTQGALVETLDGERLGTVIARGVDTTLAEDTGGEIRFVQDGAAGTKVPTEIQFLTASSTTIPSEKMTIRSDGRVGIGTGTPSLPLDVKAKSGMSAIGGFAVKMTNKTGANSVAGQLVTVYTATAIDDAFKTQVASGDNTIGIVLESGVSDGSEAWVVVSGIADVLMDAGGSARGDRIISSATAGSGDVWNTGGAVATHFLEIGHCIETRTGAGLARCVLHFN